MASPSATDRKRPIRSYVLRSGRLTDSQRKAIEQYWQDYVIDYEAQLIPLDSLFPQAAELVVEIGFGMGASLVQMAEQNPACNFLGIEVHRPGVGRVLREIAARGLSNLKLMCHDAGEVLEHCFRDESIDTVLIFFPDPWPKKRHSKRRLIQADFARLLQRKLKAGGTLHLATDWQAYAEHMIEVLECVAEFENCAGNSRCRQIPERPVTRFEQRGRRLGHEVRDLLFVKRDRPRASTI